MRRAAVLLALCACVPENGPLMRPGEDCLACHGGQGTLPFGERTRHAKAWTVAGTVFETDANAQFEGAGIEGAEVQITDAAGWSFSLRTNLAGNFYTREGVQFQLHVCVAHGSARRCMESPSATGGCNGCHGLAVTGAPQPPLTAP